MMKFLKFVYDDKGQLSEVLADREALALMGGRVAAALQQQLPIETDVRYKRFSDLPVGLIKVLADAGIRTPFQLAERRREDVMAIRGVGERKIAYLESVLMFHRLSFRIDDLQS